MNRIVAASIVGMVAAAGCLAACSPSRTPAAPAPSASEAVSDKQAASYRTLANRGDGPRVEEISAREGRQMAAAWCIDLEAGDKASAMAAINEQASQIDAANVMLFAIESVCPELRSKVE